VTKYISDLTLIDAKQFHTFYDFAFTLRLVWASMHKFENWQLLEHMYICVCACECIGKYVRSSYETLMNYLQ